MPVLRTTVLTGLENEKGQRLPIRECPLPVHSQMMWAKLSDQVAVPPIQHLARDPQSLAQGAGLGGSILLGRGRVQWGVVSGGDAHLAVWDNLQQSRPRGRGQLGIRGQTASDHSSATYRLEELE